MSVGQPATRRLGYLALAYGCVGLGVVGAFLPVMPTTPFLLVALWAGARSSPRLRYRLYRHPRYGPPLRAWHRHGAVARSAKLAACALMIASWSVLWLVGTPGWILATMGVFFVAVMSFILTRPAYRAAQPETVGCNLNR